MAGEWKEVAIGELAEIFDGPHATPSKTDRGPIFLGISNLAHGRLDLSSTKHLSEDDYERWTCRVEPQAGDVVFSYETRLGEAASIPPGLRCCLGRRMGLLRARAHKVDKRFLLYAYLGPQFQETLRSRTIHGSTVDRIPLIDMPSFPIVVPDSISEQRAIAHILGTLDDKIELNRRMNETLEAMVRALFKSWFIDFDPVRRNMARKGREQPSSAVARHPLPMGEGQGEGVIEGNTFDHIFPDRFQESELGEIPKGWDVVSFSSTVKILGGGTPKTSIPEYWSGDIPWFSVVDAPRESDVFVVDTEKKVTQAGVENSSTQILPKGTTIITARGTVGKIALVALPMAMNQSCYALRGRTGERGFFAYYSTRVLVSTLQQRAHGSVFDTITRDTLAGVDVVVPPVNVIEAFEQAVTPVLERIRNNLSESCTLAATRDALLPKLVSGDIRERTD